MLRRHEKNQCYSLLIVFDSIFTDGPHQLLLTITFRIAASLESKCVIASLRCPAGKFKLSEA